MVKTACVKLHYSNYGIGSGDQVTEGSTPSSLDRRNDLVQTESRCCYHNLTCEKLADIYWKSGGLASGMSELLCVRLEKIKEPTLAGHRHS